MDRSGLGSSASGGATRVDRSVIQHMAGKVVGKDQARSAAGADTACDGESFGASRRGATDLAGDFWNAKPTRYISWPCGRRPHCRAEGFHCQLPWLVCVDGEEWDP